MVRLKNPELLLWTLFVSKNKPLKVPATGVKEFVPSGGLIGPEQFADAVTPLPWHVSRPLAVTVTPPDPASPVKLPLNPSDSPGASSSGPRTTGLVTGWLLNS